MKTKHILLLAFAAIVLLVASCKSTEKCPAYGESKRYQVEKAY
ncbi:MAG TPA: hypothetical protein P5550_08635 [Bacteroidales bacterium]|nr:hypothetical protein [Bacteroidales bacterium]